ncbi:MAG: transcriptional regulator [Polyangiaceae bacterium]
MSDAPNEATKANSPTERNAQLVRVLSILRDISRFGGVDIYELAERYGVTERTIRRDLDALEGAGLPIESEPDPTSSKKRWRIGYKHDLKKLSELLDASHYLALRLSMGQPGPLGGGSLMFGTLEDLSDKIGEALGPRERELLRTIDRSFFDYDKFGYQAEMRDVFWPLLAAMSGRQLCQITYRAARANAYDSSYQILPLKLFSHNRTLYLHAYVPKHESVITLNLQRLCELTVLKKTIEPPADYDPDALEGSAFGVFTGGEMTHYRLRFEPHVATYIRERVWHRSQELSELKDGGVELSFTCSASPEVTAWIASWCDAVDVLEPESVRARFADIGKKMLERYG